ncbi:thiamine phosphate synthase [Limnobacter sp.]|uniref:thiamine phosphate synthase n=1 Tax=Limnobacter sp. TaxID=2003368 RepID=UPI0035198EA1
MNNAARIEGVYAITPELGGAWTEDALLECVQAALQGGVKLLQCRQKAWAEPQLRGLVGQLLGLCETHGAGLIVNDAPSEWLAAWPQAWQNSPSLLGLHLGQHDEPISTARAHLPLPWVLGASCYNRIEVAQQAVAQGASYVAFGAVFASPTKPQAVRAPLALFQQASALGVPSVAIGGIGVVHLPLLKAAGANAVATVSGLFGAQPNPHEVKHNARLWVKTFESGVAQ